MAFQALHIFGLWPFLKPPQVFQTIHVHWTAWSFLQIPSSLKNWAMRGKFSWTCILAPHCALCESLLRLCHHCHWHQWETWTWWPACSQGHFCLVHWRWIRKHGGCLVLVQYSSNLRRSRCRMWCEWKCCERLCMQTQHDWVNSTNRSGVELSKVLDIIAWWLWLTSQQHHESFSVEHWSSKRLETKWNSAELFHNWPIRTISSK